MTRSLCYIENAIVDHLENGFRYFEGPEVHLWILKYHADFLSISQIEALLSYEEMERSNAFHLKQDFRRYIFAHGMLRLILSKYTGHPPQRIEFLKGPFGKPLISNYAGIQFNLSHTENLIAIAVTPDLEVGIDIEKCCPITNLSNISKNIMTTDEYHHFTRLKYKDRISFFYKSWVRKEAIVKAWGTGIDDKLRMIPVLENSIFTSELKIFTNNGGKHETWMIADIDLECEFAGAVCFPYHEQNKVLRLNLHRGSGTVADLYRQPKWR